MSVQKKTTPINKKKSWKKILWAQKALILMSIPLLLHRILFSYFPLTGWVMAFQNFQPRVGRGWLDHDWVGLRNFQDLFQGLMGQRFIQSIINTLGQSVLILITGTIGAILLALLLNEVMSVKAKKVIQNILYMPHFLSWVIVAGLASVALALPQSGGIINDMLMRVGILREPIQFLAHPQYFWGIVAITNLWKSVGWNTIIYLAAMTGIDPALYEAAEVDGANRYQKMRYITLPGIRSTIVVLLILNVGWILTSGFELQWILGNGMNVSRSENIDIFILRYGIEQGRFGLATAAGILRTGVSVTLVFAANMVAKRLGQERVI